MSVLPESVAAERIAAAISPHLSPAWLTERCIRDLAMKCVAHRDFIRGIFDELDQDPHAIGDRGEVLKQQRTADTSSVDWFLEEAAYHKRGYEEAVAAAVKAGAHPADYAGPDEKNADEDQDRWSREIADEKAERDAPRLGAAS